MKNKAAQQLGKLGGKANSPAKKRAARENGKLGGRPKKKKQRDADKASTQMQQGSPAGASQSGKQKGKK